MSAIDVLVFVLLTLFCYVLVWALIDRICKCCEKCSYYRAFGEYTKMGNSWQHTKEPNDLNKRKEAKNE